jgi:hypothetical protein
MNDKPTNRPRRSSSRSRSGASKARGKSLWQAGPSPGPPPKIEPAENATKFIESLDPLPLHGNKTQYYVAAVVERAAGLALAVAASAGLLASDADEPDTEPMSQ